MHMIALEHNQCGNKNLNISLNDAIRTNMSNLILVWAQLFCRHEKQIMNMAQVKLEQNKSEGLRFERVAHE